MDIILGLVVNVLEEGFIYGIMAIGVYITYRVLGFPDLSVDGTFPLGACVTAALISAGADPWLSCLIAFVCGAAAGCLTGFLHVKLGITDLLSGILVMTGLWSVNLVITKGSAVMPFYDKNTIFNSGFSGLLAGSLPENYRVLVIVAVSCVVVKLLLDIYLKTKSGLLLRASGDNAQYVTSLGKNPGTMKIIGLAIGNGCTALAGCILSQQTQSASVASGTGMVVMALASVIIGTNLFRKIKFVKATTAAVFGAIIYKACLVIAMQLGLPTNYLKLLMAVLFTIALISNNLFAGRGKKQNVNPTQI
ncbi:ABC transporter permease [Caproiciproducens sp.]|uniref:ABC transporter permease n=1 Tax=Caproiciproducens sp. TaxID=1954376 RepID=UPI00289F3461|nr:ABC transporter permease [Caproiciproducens sp.]